MKIEKRTTVIAVIFVNLAFVLAFKGLYVLNFFSLFTPAELKDSYPKFYEITYWWAQKTNLLFFIWLTLFLIVNGLFIYLLAIHYNKVKEIILFSVVLILSFIGAEFILRKLKFKPGTHTYIRYFNPVDSLYPLEGFAADSLGIFKIDLQSRQKICENIRAKNPAYSETQVHEVFSLALESIELMEGKIDNNFSKVYKQLAAKDTSALSELEKVIIDYVHCPVNEDGFRSIAFRQYPTAKKKVLLIGDSFTWGHSTSKKSYSFADELLAKDYVVYNAGMTATDVAQYLAVAKQYIPVLKPDVVIVNFYLGNDVTFYKREVKPFTPIFYPTNAGILMACPQGKYFENAQEAYTLNLHQWQIPKDDNIINCIMAQTVITTLAWRALVKLELANYGSSDVGKYYMESKKRKYTKPYCNIELKELKEFAKNNGAEFILSSIPEVYNYTCHTKKDFPDLFEGLDYVEMQISKSDYKLDDGHFNDQGHKRYANFLIQQMEKHE